MGGILEPSKKLERGTTLRGTVGAGMQIGICCGVSERGCRPYNAHKYEQKCVISVALQKDPQGGLMDNRYRLREDKRTISRPVVYVSVVHRVLFTLRSTDVKVEEFFFFF